MKRTWIISDHHFGHENIIKYCDRPFKDVAEMNKEMIESWNNAVAEGDTVYHLGDFALQLEHEEYEKIINSLNGDIILIKGNHDKKGKAWLKNVGFKEVHEQLALEDRYILSHSPLEPSQIPEGYVNIHGHIHNKDRGLDKEKYINVSCEVLEYVPALLLSKEEEVEFNIE